MNALKSEAVQVPRQPAHGLRLHCLPSPVALRPAKGDAQGTDSLRGSASRGRQRASTVIKAPLKLSNTPPLEQNFQTAGHAGLFVGHENKLVGHKQHFKE